MVEVFNTSVKDQKQANELLQKLSIAFPNYEINFDLEDCDHILRVASRLETIKVFRIIDLLNELGFIAHLLSDTPSFSDESIDINSIPNYKF